MKCYKASRKDTELANECEKLLNGVCARLEEGLGGVFVDRPEEADVILLVEPFSNKGKGYRRRILSCSFLSKYVEKVVVINWDVNATPCLRGLYTTLRASREQEGWFHSIPYLHYPNPLVLEGGRSSTPSYLASYRGNPKSHPIRKELFDHFGSDERFLIENTNAWFDHSVDEQRSYVETILSGKFSLCPPGYSVTSYRVQESMALGRCPVIIADDYPRDTKGAALLKASIQVKESDLPSLAEILRDYESEWCALGNQARAEFEKFRPELVEETLAKLLLEIPVGTAGPSKQQILQHWQSKAFIEANLWRWDQRVRGLVKRYL